MPAGPAFAARKTSDSWVRAALPRRYLVLNCALNLLNRWALGLYGLRFPLVMTASHMIFGACALSPLMILNESYSSRHAHVISVAVMFPKECFLEPRFASQIVTFRS